MSDPGPVDPQPSDAPDPEIGRLQRENALLRAGVDLSTPIGGLIAKGYDGPLELAAIKTYVDQVAPPPAIPVEPEVTPLAPGEREAQRIRDAIAVGAVGEQREQPGDPREEGLQLARNGLKLGMREEEAIGGFVNHVADAYMTGRKGLTVDERQTVRGGRVPR